MFPSEHSCCINLGAHVEPHRVCVCEGVGGGGTKAAGIPERKGQVGGHHVMQPFQERRMLRCVNAAEVERHHLRTNADTRRWRRLRPASEAWVNPPPAESFSPCCGSDKMSRSGWGQRAPPAGRARCPGSAGSSWADAGRRARCRTGGSCRHKKGGLALIEASGKFLNTQDGWRVSSPYVCVCRRRHLRPHSACGAIHVAFCHSGGKKNEFDGTGGTHSVHRR